MYVLIKNRGPKSEALDYCDARIQSEVSETPGNAKQTRFTWRKSPNYGWKTKKLTGERGGGRGEKEEKTRGSEGKHYFTVGSNKQTAMKYSRMCLLVLLI
jgi:hypothetical protein